MRLEEFEVLRQTENRANTINARELSLVPQTLLYGYYVSRNTLHVYMQNSRLHTLRYDHNETVIEHLVRDEFVVGALYPDKRIYPESTDYQFSQLLLARGGRLTFTSWNQQRFDQVWNKRYHGLVCPCNGSSHHGPIN